ncbi:MAG: sigma-E processing peptidase SpoIIGA [Clostridia bacterium]|nr:sigma-E processing peptidase SpoIIGA [Clostridia bacterium]
MVVYADVIFLINFISAYIMLYILGKAINKVRIRKKRLFLASVLGAAGAAVIFCVEMPTALSYLTRILAVFLMIFTAFFEQRKQLLNQILWLVLMSGIMIFSMMLITTLIKNTVSVVIKAGIVYFDIPPKVFLFAFILSYFVLIFFLKVFKNRKNKKYYIMSVTHNDKTVTVTALFDSGNLLKEPVTGKYVSILEWDYVKKLFGAEYEFSDIENHAEEMKLWVIPFNSLGNSSGMLFAFLADNITIPEEKKIIDKTFIGIYGGVLSKNNEYHALINAGLL